jgi:pimeloyl-ACP methyl ester carboxylesterase
VVETRSIDGRTVTFRHEPGRAPALVCIHGSADNHRAYDRLLDVASGRERYAINMPGRAGAEGPALGSVAELARFLSRFVESEVEGDYWVVGHSLGGAVAIEHALTSASGRLKGIVLLATGARLRVHPMILQLFDQVAETGKHPPLPPGLYEQGADPELLAEANENRLLTPIETGGKDWRAANGFDRMQDLPKIALPALIVAGTDDMLTPPKYAEYMASTIPNNELHIIEGAGHMLVAERAPQISQWIEGFIERICGK